MRKISVFLVIAIVVMLSTMLISCESDAASEGLWYQLTTDGSGYVVTSLGNCEDKKIIIPEEYNGKPVVEIAPLAFYYCYSVVEVKMPNTITKIGYSAFEGCNNLESIKLSNSLTTIEYDAFLSCNSLTSIAIPKSVTSIGRGIFNYCYELKRINFTGTVKQWQAIDKPDGWDVRTGDYTVYCIIGKILKNGEVRYL